jgi:hypothetical protein
MPRRGQRVVKQSAPMSVDVRLPLAGSRSVVGRDVTEWIADARHRNLVSLGTRYRQVVDDLAFWRDEPSADDRMGLELRQEKALLERTIAQVVCGVAP